MTEPSEKSMELIVQEGFFPSAAEMDRTEQRFRKEVDDAKRALEAGGWRLEDETFKSILTEHISRTTDEILSLIKEPKEGDAVTIINVVHDNDGGSFFGVREQHPDIKGDLLGKKLDENKKRGNNVDGWHAIYSRVGDSSVSADTVPLEGLEGKHSIFRPNFGSGEVYCPSGTVYVFDDKKWKSARFFESDEPAWYDG